MKTTHLLWRLICARPVSSASKPLVMLVCYVERIIFGLTVQAFFNALPAQPSLTARLLLIFVPWACAVVIRLLVVSGGTYGIVTFEFATGAQLQRNLLQRLLALPGSRALTSTVGDVLNHFRDDTHHVVELLSSIGDAGALLVYALAALIILLRTNSMLTLLVFLPLCAILALARLVEKRLEGYRSAGRQATSAVSGAIGEIIGAVQAIQVAGAEQSVVAHFALLNNQRRAAMLRDSMASGLLGALFGNAIDIGTALILVLAALSATQLRPGDLVLFLTYTTIVTDFFSTVGMLLAQQAQTRASFTRLTKLLQGAPPELLVAKHVLTLRGSLPTRTMLPQPAVPPLESLELHNLSYHYPDTGRGIADVNLHITRGTLTVITGRVGSGKSTLVQTLLGLLPHDGGTIVWNGEPVADPASFFVPPRSAYTPQVPHLFSDPLKENILLDLSEQATDLPRAIHDAVLEHDLASLEHGLDTRIGTRGVKLSGGQVKRTAAARMLVRDPELLVFDDLSSALDVETEQLLWQRLFAAERRTCLVVSHHRAVLQRADQIMLLQDGRVTAIGTLDELLAQEEEMRAIWQNQL